MPIKHKFKAKPTTIDEITFHSRAEAHYYRKLKLAQESGKLLFFLMQVPFRLPGKVKYLVDFVEFWDDGVVKFVDIKGAKTPMSTLKIKQTEDIYPVTIDIVQV